MSKYNNKDGWIGHLFGFGLLIIGILLFVFAEPSEESIKEDAVKVEQSEARFTTELIEKNGIKEYEIMTDHLTGCQYIINGGSKFTSGMSPLLDEYGKPTGCKGVE